LQLETLVRQCGVTLLLALTPGYDMITNQFLTLYFSAMDHFGSLWQSGWWRFEELMEELKKSWRILKGDFG
jgi:hypothetical protein